MPINEWAKENCFLWLWVTNSKDKKTKEPILKMGFEILEHWGFTYYTTITWDKKTGPCPFGPYQITKTTENRFVFSKNGESALMSKSGW